MQLDNQILLAIGRVEGKLDGITATQSNHNNRLDNHGSRIGALEQKQARSAGFAAAVALGISTAIGALGVAAKYLIGG